VTAISKEAERRPFLVQAAEPVHSPVFDPASALAVAHTDQALELHLALRDLLLADQDILVRAAQLRKAVVAVVPWEAAAWVLAQRDRAFLVVVAAVVVPSSLASPAFLVDPSAAAA